MGQENNIQIFDTGELAKAVAELIVKIANEAIGACGRFVISLSGGHTPETLYSVLCTEPYQGRIAWDKLFFFWGDERCVPTDSAENNMRMAKIFLLDHVDVPPSNIYPVPVDVAPEAAAAAYENSIKQFFGDEPPRFDLILLGLGENGHTASLFSGTGVLTGHTRLIQEVFVQEQNIYRITMTATLINQASNIIFLVAGDSKSEILDIVLNAPYQPDKYPAQLIKPVDGNLYWFVDTKAAALLNKRQKI
jgi:6-phosphogluconolactonase